MGSSPIARANIGYAFYTPSRSCIEAFVGVAQTFSQFSNAPVAQLVERKAYTLRMHQISARLSVRARPGVPFQWVFAVAGGGGPGCKPECIHTNRFESYSTHHICISTK